LKARTVEGAFFQTANDNAVAQIQQCNDEQADTNQAHQESAAD
jgi:hypothetical protein